MTNLSMPRCDIEELKGQIEQLKALNTADDLKQMVRDSAKQVREIIDNWNKGVV